MTEPAFQSCEVCGRVVLADGPFGRIEAAFDRDGAHLVVHYLEQLASSGRRAKEDLDDIAERVSLFALSGELEIPRELNDLGDGLWELKTSRSRYPFYYTEPQSFARVRITHGFRKSEGRTAQGRTTFHDLDLAKAIRREDEAR